MTKLKDMHIRDRRHPVFAISGSAWEKANQATTGRFFSSRDQLNIDVIVHISRRTAEEALHITDCNRQIHWAEHRLAENVRRNLLMNDVVGDDFVICPKCGDLDAYRSVALEWHEAILAEKRRREAERRWQEQERQRRLLEKHQRMAGLCATLNNMGLAAKVNQQLEIEFSYAQGDYAVREVGFSE
jgi:hypothetical protein